MNKNLSKKLKFPSEARKFEISWKIFEIFVQDLSTISFFHCLFPATPPSHGSSPAIPLFPGWPPWLPKEFLWGIPPQKNTWAPWGFFKAYFPKNFFGEFHPKKTHGPHEDFWKPIPGKNHGPHEDSQANPGRILRSGTPLWTTYFRAVCTSPIVTQCEIVNLDPFWPRREF